MSTWSSFEEIEAWILARKLAKDVYRLFHETPLSNDFGLRNQMNTSSGSVMDNIAEGFGRGGNKEFINFLTFSKGSNLELKSQIYRCYDRGYINEEECEVFKKTIVEVDGKLGGLIAYLKRSGYKGSKFK